MTGFSDHSILHYVVTVACGLHVWYIIQVCTCLLHICCASHLCIAAGWHCISTLLSHKAISEVPSVSVCYRP